AKGKSRSQQITVKYPWYVNSSRDPMSDELDRPSAGLVQAKQPLIWLLTYNADAGAYDEFRINFFELTNGLWRSIPTQGKVPEFSPRGSFYLDRSLLRVWDFEFDPQYAHWDKQPYTLRSYRISHHVREISLHRTRLRYSPEVAEPLVMPEQVEPANDPLREFGL